MKGSNRRDLRRRQTCAHFEISRILLKASLYDEQLPTHLRQHAASQLAQQPRDASRTRLRNRCVITGRSRGILRHFRLSRLQFRNMAAQGLLPGIRRAQW